MRQDRILFIIVIMLFLVTVLFPSFQAPIIIENDSRVTLYVGGTGPGNFSNIQYAIDNASSGDTVFIYNGTYFEHISIKKTMNLIGEDKFGTIINGNDSGIVIKLKNLAYNVNISNLTVMDGGNSVYIEDSSILIETDFNTVEQCVINSSKFGIRIYGDKNKVINNTIVSNEDGIFNEGKNNSIAFNYFNNQVDGLSFAHAEYNIINNNDFYGHNGAPIRLEFSSNYNMISYNFAENNDGGISLWGGHDNIVHNNTLRKTYWGTTIKIDSSDNNTVVNNQLINNQRSLKSMIIKNSEYNFISNNTIYDNKDIGMYMQGSSYNIIESNTIENNIASGIVIHHSSNNTFIANNIIHNNIGLENTEDSFNNLIYHNNFLNNNLQAKDNYSNFWNSNYPVGGNYWDDYTGFDNYYGPAQDILGSDGIGDIPYHISNRNNQDNYPLISPWNGTSLPIPLPSMVYVDDNYDSSIPGWQYDHFDIIQDGVSAVADNGTVYVYNGIYNENIILNKTINLIGENKDLTIINGSSQTYVMDVLSDNVNITGFCFNNPGGGYEKIIIYLNNVEYCDITNNRYNNNLEPRQGYFIKLFNSNNISIYNNSILDGSLGIFIENSHLNQISFNRIQDCNCAYRSINSNYNSFNNNSAIDNDCGFFITTNKNNIFSNNSITFNGPGLQIDNSNNNSFTHNYLYDNSQGILIQNSFDNIFLNNTIDKNDEGISIYSSNKNKMNNNNIVNNMNYGIYLNQDSSQNIIYNNIFDNSNNAQDYGINIWNISKTNGYNIIAGPYLGGNYWHDYPGADYDNDGLGDTEIPFGPGDQHPLTQTNFGPIADFNSSTNYTWLNNTINFTDLSTDSDGIIVNWTWDMGDGTILYNQHPTHQYTVPSIYTVILTVTDDNGAYNSTSYEIWVIGIDVNQSNQNRGFPIRHAQDGDWGGAQNFTPTLNSFTKSEIYLRKFGNPEFDLVVELREDTIDGIILDTLIFTPAEVASSWTWLELDFTDITVIPGIDYFIKCPPAPSGVTTSFGYEWGYAFGNQYDDGSFWFTRDGGNLWRDLPTMYEMVFKTYGYT